MSVEFRTEMLNFSETVSLYVRLYRRWLFMFKVNNRRFKVEAYCIELYRPFLKNITDLNSQRICKTKHSNFVGAETWIDSLKRFSVLTYHLFP